MMGELWLWARSHLVNILSYVAPLPAKQGMNEGPSQVKERPAPPARFSAGENPQKHRHDYDLVFADPDQLEYELIWRLRRKDEKVMARHSVFLGVDVVLASMHLADFKNHPEEFVRVFLERLEGQSIYVITPEELSAALCKYINGPVTQESVRRLLERMVVDRK